jgi:signal transduction histidine kinase
MSSSQAEVEGGVLAASRIAADPAFAALDASGAPILAADGDPLRIVYLNDSARAVFGADVPALAARLFQGAEPGARRLLELVDSVRQGAALRLERLRLDLDGAPQTITILCRRLADDAGDAHIVIAALGLRAASTDAEGADADGPEAIQALRARLTARHGARAPRFLWKTDAAGRFTEITPTLAEVAGARGAEIVGRGAAEVARDFGFGPAFAAAILAQKSWAGLEVDWPLDEAGARAPTTLGGLPALDPIRGFGGFQGYGVIHLDRAYLVAPAAAAPPKAPAPEFYAADNVVPLRPLTPRPETDDKEALTSAERQNFDEIARTLQLGDLDDATPADEVEEPPPTEACMADVAAELGALIAAAETPAPSAADIAGVLDCLPVGVLIARGASTLFVNRTLLDYLGYADARSFEVDGGLARMFFGRPPADAGARAAAVQSSEGEALDVDVHLQTVHWEGAPATLVTLRRHRARVAPPEDASLVREREKLARARADNALLRGILETSGVAVAALGDDGRIESATGAFSALFDAERGAFDGLPLSSLFSADDARMLATRLTRFGEPTAQLRLVARVGGKAFEATLRELGPTQKRCLTLRQEAARADDLAAARDAAEQANAAKSDFLARVSHEIRTPLNAIIGFAEVMMEERLGPIGSERYKEYLKDVHASGEHVLSLVNDLLDLSKIEAGKMELEFDRVDANAVISECASIMQAQANKARVVVRLALASGLPRVRADQRSLKQILLNLLSNALKFNEPGGQVIVSSAVTDSGFVVIRVKDTGIGMSDEEVQTALEPFKQVATAHRKLGTGLGLPLTKALIEANQASLTIRSRKNEGTLIEIAFPPLQVLAAE